MRKGTENDYLRRRHRCEVCGKRNAMSFSNGHMRLHGSGGNSSSHASHIGWFCGFECLDVKVSESRITPRPSAGVILSAQNNKNK